jgi:hydrogenase nickel incorporation protein HypB
MCAICGCTPNHHDDHDHDHHHHGQGEHHHAQGEHHHGQGEHHQHHDAHFGHTVDGRAARVLSLEERVLARNDEAAASNRSWLAQRRVWALNLLSSPGAGKTTLLESTIQRLDGQLSISVIEGDQETDEDARRIRASGRPVIQINTGTGCHLDAAMVGRALDALAPDAGTLVFIENVGNLVCPALFDLGEQKKVLIAAVTEGEDKPIKYPYMFRAADLIVLNKVDLLPHVRFDVARFREHVRRVNARAEVLPVSALTGHGLGAFCGWLRLGAENACR